MTSKSGGGIYLHQTDLRCYDQGNLKLVNNTGGLKGGEIYASSSSISAYNYGEVIFDNNSAIVAGGGTFLEQNSKLYILMLADTIAESISDETNSGTSASLSYQAYSTKTECFVQLLSLQSEYFGRHNLIVMVFIDNCAYISGPDLFGGLLDRCTITLLAERNSDQPDTIDSVLYFLDVSVSTINRSDSISSAPVRVCFCTEIKQPNCTYNHPVVNTKKGETFVITLVAVDQVNSTVPSVTIHSRLSSSFGGVGENQKKQSTGKDCTDLMFEVFSPHTSEHLNLYAEGPCKDAPLSQVVININFSSCECPIGFQQMLSRSVCECECDSDIKPCD